MLWIKKDSPGTATVYLDDFYSERVGVVELEDGSFSFFDAQRSAKLLVALDNKLGFKGFSYDVCPVTIKEKKELMKKGLPGWRIMYKIYIEKTSNNEIQKQTEKERVS